MARADTLVSVVMPAFNAERWITESLASVLGQTHSNLQVIVVDDGSTDSTREKVERIADSRLSLSTQNNAGAAAARNHGLKLASGDFVQFLDADDILSVAKIEVQLSALMEVPRMSVASCPWGHFESDVNHARFVPEPVWSEQDPIQWLITSLSGGGMMQTATWLTPSDLIKQVGSWNEGLTGIDDGEFFTRVLLAAEKNVFVPEAKVFYRKVPESLSRRRTTRDVTAAFLVCELRDRHLLAKLDSVESRTAIATQYAQFVYEHGRDAPSLARQAMARIDELGVKPRTSIGGNGFRVASQILGFERAVRLRESIGGRIV
jgi:glycosyltransferase involved in cell wall biosynthesis